MSDTDPRFDRPLYTVSQAARYVGMPVSTFHAWARGYQADSGRGRHAPIILTLKKPAGQPSVPFIGLVEAMVVQAFRQTGLPLQRIRRAIEILAERGELKHALASRSLFTDGAEVLYNYAEDVEDPQLRLLVVRTGQRVFHEVIKEYLDRIEFDDEWATSVTLPVTDTRILRVRPDVASGEPLFIHGGAPLPAVLSRVRAGEPVPSVAADYGVPEKDIQEVVDVFTAPKTAA